MKKALLYLGLCASVFIGTSAIQSNPNADTGRTGAASGVTCRDGCHNSFALNTAGGYVSVTGLPTTTYSPSTAYPFSVKIRHSAKDRKNWGFAIKAVNATTGVAVGTFSTTNTTNVRIASNEATSKAAATTPAGDSVYTFMNITWTAPAIASSPTNLKFYFVGNAGNASNSTAGDYIYSSTLSATLLPIIISNFSVTPDGANAILNWRVENDLDTKNFIVERSADKINFIQLATFTGSNTATAKSYTYNDTKLANGDNYYRLKMIDKNGSVTFSKIISLLNKNNLNSVFNIYPNPLKKGADAKIEVLSNKEQIATFALINMQGNVVSVKQKQLNQGYTNTSLNFGNYIATGTYKLQVKIGNDIIKSSTIIITE